MARFIKSRNKSIGAIPGSLIFIGQEKMTDPEINLIIYTASTIEEKRLATITDFPKGINNEAVVWLNIYGLQNTLLIEEIGKKFQIPTLELEDILNTDQRPKIIENENNLTIFLKNTNYNINTHSLITEQITIFLSKNIVITFQEKPTHSFEPIRKRIRNNIGRIRSSKSDYLTYTLLDTLIDGYLYTIENIGSYMESLEEEVLQNYQKSTLKNLYQAKINISQLRKSILPIKEIMYYLSKTKFNQIKPATYNFLKDLNDLTIQAFETVEIYNNMANDFLNIYHSNVASRTNDIMKVLTIYASIFIPLTFIAGIYGTNFDNIPELHYKYGYYIMLGVMIIIVLCMLLFFRRKKWM